MDLGFAFKIMRARAPGAQPQEMTAGSPDPSVSTASGVLESGAVTASGGGKSPQRQSPCSSTPTGDGPPSTAMAPRQQPQQHQLQQQQQQQQQPTLPAERASPKRQQSGPRRTLSGANLTLAPEEPSSKALDSGGGYGLAAVLAQEAPSSGASLHMIPRPLVPSARGVTIGPFAEAIAAASIRPPRRRVDVGSLPLPPDRGRSTAHGATSSPSSPLVSPQTRSPKVPQTQTAAGGGGGGGTAGRANPPRGGGGGGRARVVLLPQVSTQHGRQHLQQRNPSQQQQQQQLNPPPPPPQQQQQQQQQVQQQLQQQLQQRQQQQQYGEALPAGTGRTSATGVGGRALGATVVAAAAAGPRPSSTSAVEGGPGQLWASVLPLPLPLPGVDVGHGREAPPLQLPPRASPRSPRGAMASATVSVPGLLGTAGAGAGLLTAHVSAPVDLTLGPMRAGAGGGGAGAGAGAGGNRPGSAGDRGAGWRLPAAVDVDAASAAAGGGDGGAAEAAAGAGGHHGDPAHAAPGGCEDTHVARGGSRSLSGAANGDAGPGRDGPTSLPALPMLGRLQHAAATTPGCAPVASGPGPGPGLASAAGQRGAVGAAPPSPTRQLLPWGSEKMLLVAEASTLSGMSGFDGDGGGGGGGGFGAEGLGDLEADAAELDSLERWAASAQLSPAVLEATAEQRRALRRLAQLRNRLLHGRGYNSVCTSPEPGSGGLHAVPSWADLVVTSRRGSESLVAMANQVSRLPHIDYDQMRDPQYRMMLKLRSRQAKVHHPVINDELEDMPIRGRRRPWKPLHI